MSLKITLIGAGSVVFAKNLLGDILRMPELSHATICLMDIDAERLKVAKIMVTRMITTLNIKANVVATSNRREAVKDSNYIICTIQVGGYKPGTVIDFEIPRKYGLLQTIGDTLGVGGVFRALRTIPVLVDLARDIADVGAPGCLLLNYANPMAMNCSAIARAVGIPHVGLCHSVQSTLHQLASYAGLDHQDITYLVAGINHMAFFLKFEYRGQDAYPFLFNLLRKPAFKEDLVRFEMMRRTGYFVTESSEHQSEYVPYFIHHGKKVIESFNVPIDEYLRRCESVISSWHKTEAELLGTDSTFSLNPPSHEYGSSIIHSCQTDTPRVIYGNVPNTHLIDNLPREACVEVPCLVNAQGIQPTHVGPLPPQLAALCMTNINVQTLTVEAALTRKREHIYHAVMLDPHTATVLTLDKVWAMCDELILAHQKHGLLGEFAQTIPNTGRGFAGTGEQVLGEVRPITVKNGKIKAELTFTNPRQTPFTSEITVTCEDIEQVLATKSTCLKVRVPAGRTVCKSILIPAPANRPDGFIFRLSSSSAKVLTHNFVLPRRPSYSIANGGEAFIHLDIAGVPAVKGSLTKQDDHLALHLVVNDTKINPQKHPWEGSVVELFFDGTKTEGIQQLFIIPGKSLRKVEVLDHELKKNSFIKADIHPNEKGGGYELDVKLPLVKIGIQPAQKEFLFDLIARVSALGDAHSGGFTSLSGGFNSWQISSSYARIEL